MEDVEHDDGDDDDPMSALLSVNNFASLAIQGGDERFIDAVVYHAARTHDDELVQAARALADASLAGAPVDSILRQVLDACSRKGAVSSGTIWSSRATLERDGT